MEVLTEFFIRYFALICLSIVMIVNAIMHFSINRRVSICSILITVSCLLLAVSFVVQMYAKPRGLYYTTMLLSIMGYALRPTCLYLFILMNKNAYRGKWSFFIWLPLVLNLIIYLCALIPGASSTIFGFHIGDDGSLSFIGGPLRYTSHIIAIGYLIYLFYISIFTLKSKHIMHGVTLMVCAAFVVAAVVIETFVDTSYTIELLNTTIMVSTLAYYLFLYKEHMQIDTLTGLFNRETYYRDLTNLSRTFTGVIQLDINGLKYINDTFGHHKGDECIYAIAQVIAAVITKSMYAYRMGGDEFLIIANGTREEDIVETVARFKEEMSITGYYCSAGYALRKDPSVSLDDVIKEAEKNMYIEKEAFYKNPAFERRKV